MKYYYNKILKNITFKEVVEQTILALQKEGFGVLTEIDIQATFKKKLDIDFYNYKILGACNPEFAHKALQAEDKIGTLLPCNVIVQEKKPGLIEVAAINPMASMQSVLNMKILHIAEDVGNKLKNVLKSI